MNLKWPRPETVDWLKVRFERLGKLLFSFPWWETFFLQTADTIVLRLVKHRKEAETLVEHLDYDRYSDQRKANFAKQSQQAANDQRTYDKTMEKHRRVKQNVETALRATGTVLLGPIG